MLELICTFSPIWYFRLIERKRERERERERERGDKNDALRTWKFCYVGQQKRLIGNEWGRTAVLVVLLRTFKTNAEESWMGGVKSMDGSLKMDGPVSDLVELKS